VRRLLALGTLLAAVAAGGALLLGGSAQGSSDYRVDVIFDNARGLISGQLAKIAGARVGTIQDVTLTADYKARVEMSVDGRFAPFHADASCTIRPEGLIAENYVECDPGTANAPALEPKDGHAPTVPVSRTSEPVNLTDLFDIWQAPTRDRFALIVNELGIGLSSHGQDINSILRRANPTLKLVRQALAILQRQRGQIATIVDSSDQLLAQLGSRSGRVGDFLARAADVAATTGAHSSSLAAATQRLPGLLAAAQPALASVDQIARNGTPIVAALRRAAPSVNDMSAAIGPFATAARPALASLGHALVTGTATIRKVTPVIHTLRAYAHASRPSAVLAGKLFTSLRDRGFVESLLSFFYYAAAATARFDSISHILPAHISINLCSQFATTENAGCSANFSSSPSTGTLAARTRKRTASAKPTASATAGAPAPSAAATPTQRLLGLVQQLGQSLTSAAPAGTPADQLLDSLAGYLLR
jgi:virulence factor Mce-like protein